MSAVYDVTDLRVYQRTLNLYPSIIRLANLLPDRYHKQRTQLINSGGAIAPLIAEGWAKRRNETEVKRYFEMATAESDEPITHLRQVKYLTEIIKRIKIETCDALIERYKIVSKELYNLIKNWNSFQKGK